MHIAPLFCPILEYCSPVWSSQSGQRSASKYFSQTSFPVWQLFDNIALKKQLQQLERRFMHLLQNGSQHTRCTIQDFPDFVSSRTCDLSTPRKTLHHSQTAFLLQPNLELWNSLAKPENRYQLQNLNRIQIFHLKNILQLNDFNSC